MAAKVTVTLTLAQAHAVRRTVEQARSKLHAEWSAAEQQGVGTVAERELHGQDGAMLMLLDDALRAFE